MIARTTITLLLIGLPTLGCVKVEGGFKYEYDGRVLLDDGKTPAKGVSVRLARADDQTQTIDLTDKTSKASVKYNDHTIKRKTDGSGHYVGILETSHGWSYKQVMGAHVGPTHAPEPPALDEVILYVDEKGAKKTGYRIKVPPENQSQASSGVRKIHVPDLLLPTPTTKPTKGTTQPAAAQ